MDKGNLSRRGLLARSLGGLAAAGLPLWFAREMVVDAQEKGAEKKSDSPNNRLVMAAIGTGPNRPRRGDRPLSGERGVHIMQDAMGKPGVQFIAVCDVDRPNADFAANLVNQRNRATDCRIYTNYRQLLENRDIQAVTIGTPDHWHAQVAIAAMRAGKDVYCEKPLTLTIDEGKALVRVARETGRVLQTGSQQRSEMNGRFRLASELVRNGRIGRVVRIETRIGDNPVGGPFPTAPVPDGLNWDMWLGQTPRVEYVPQRCFYDFRWWYEYSGGKMTDWGAHHNDIAQWALNMDDSGPVTVMGQGDAPSREPNSFNCHPHFTVTYTYANGQGGGEGTQLVCTSRGENGIQFVGENGRWIFVSRSVLRASDQQIIDEPLPQNATRLEVVSNGHMGNFLDCVRSTSNPRRLPIANVNVGHHSVTVCHIGTIATRFFPGQTLHWNPQEQRFTGANADEANRHLSRPRREGYALEA